MTAAAGVEGPGWSTSAAFADFDADGLLDLNENRSWQELTNLTLEIRLPPGGLAVSPALQALLKEASSP